MDVTKLLLLIVGLALLAMAIYFAVQWAAPIVTLGQTALNALTTEQGAEGWGGFVPYPIQGYEVAHWAVDLVPGLWLALMTFGSLMAVYFIWQAIMSVFGGFFR